VVTSRVTRAGEHDVSEYPYKAEDRVTSLIGTLEAVQKRDADQGVNGIALPVLDAIVEAIVEAIKDDIGRDNPVVQSVAGIMRGPASRRAALFGCAVIVDLASRVLARVEQSMALSVSDPPAFPLEPGVSRSR
jgi:hypothetical protein